MAEDSLLKNPSSLYKKCLSAYVTNLNYNVSTLDQVNYLRLLPPNILADIYVKVSESTINHQYYSYTFIYLPSSYLFIL